MNATSSTSANILACATNLIIAGGYNGFSYADIAAAVGIRKASIHHHFPAKADLVRTLVHRYRKEAAAGLAGLEHDVDDPVEQLRLYIGYWRTCISDASAAMCVCALLATELPVLPEEVALEVRSHFQSLSSWLESLLTRGSRQHRFRLQSVPKVEAEALMATVHGAMISARAYGDSAAFSLVTDQLIDRLAAPAMAAGRDT